jgi:hypothetical protein
VTWPGNGGEHRAVAVTGSSYDDSLEMSPGDAEAVQRLQEFA